MDIDPTVNRHEVVTQGQAALRIYDNHASVSQFQGYLLLVNTHLAWCLNSDLNVKSLVGAFNQEKALVGAFSVITNLRMELLEALDISRSPVDSSSCNSAVCAAADPDNPLCQLTGRYKLRLDSQPGVAPRSSRYYRYM